LKKAIKNIEISKNEEKEKHIQEPLVVLTAVEKGDNEEVLDSLIKNIKTIANDVKADNIVLYPYAHLSSNLSNPKVAQEFLEKAKKGLKKFFKVVEKAPFGYYKEFELKVKGHPLSELSRVIKGEVVEEIDSKKLLNEISRSKLDTSKLKDNDHRILGQKMNLFSFNDVAPGMVFWHNDGLVIYNKLIEFWRKEHQKAGYEEIKTPQIMDSKLWKISGHWDKYKENNFVTDYEGRPFLVKPMNCPGGMLVYKSSQKSYKDLPLRVGEVGVVHRTELSGVLNGLFRVIQFTQDDAHIFCTDKQLESEIKAIIKMINEFYEKFDLKFDHVELSTRPEKRIGENKIWDKAEKALENVLNNMDMKYKINEGDGAFYGPKIDFHVKDSQGRTWQLSTIQLDFAMPERFGLDYTDKNDKKKVPIMLHRVIYGSIERFIGILLEHTNGRLPFWLAPRQVRIINYTDRNNKSVEDFANELREREIRVDVDLESEPIGGKIKQAEMEKVHYIVVIGDKEEASGEVAVRNQGKVENMKKEDFVSKILDENIN
jgi:threonyl-tRNA synthetase